MASDSSVGLREYIEEQVKQEISRRVGDKVEIPRPQRQAIVNEALEAGTGEIEYVVRNLVRDAERTFKRRQKEEDRKAVISRDVPRFGLFFRLQHIVLAASVVLLVLTGVPIKFHQSWLGDVVATLGMVDVMRILHRAAAAALAGVSIIHMLWVVFSREGWTNFLALCPKPRDLTDLIQMMKVLLGRTTERPRFHRFNFVEKFDYWAVYWGVVIMVGTGTLLTFNTYFMNLLGKYSMNIAVLIHSDEALLATLALLIWHMYWSHLNPDKFPMNRTFLTGTMTLEEMIEEHPAELEDRIRRGEIRLAMLDGHPELQALHPRAAELDSSKEGAPA